MTVNRALLKQALNELVRLKIGASGQTLVLSHLYTFALEEWADRLGVEPRKLEKLVLVKEALPTQVLH
ncbi:hypothetical protein [Microvirga sp. Mcv34]|uniref:hypothetical protein n=1 Tax=Microvirga sp. Mcv34 TaxID=2926016 RepID=UPI0021C8C668|nr:hypothetical protein [Microvirga sp. Mcv34]